MQLPIYQIDAFTSERFGGNPAAVVPLQSWLSDSTMQAIANENNLSETAFFVTEGDVYGLRWFTPTVEVELCGHATLATAYVLFNELGVDALELKFNTRSGVLTVRRDGSKLVLDFPRWEVTAIEEWPATWRTVIGESPTELYWTSNREVLFAVLADAEQVRSLQPRLESFGELGVGALIVTAAGNRSDCVCRFFAPGYGIAEDPGTGSIHCAIAPFWGQRLGKTRVVSRQLSARGAYFDCDVSDERVLIKGTAVRFLAGILEV